jgi:hypothetical protein
MYAPLDLRFVIGHFAMGFTQILAGCFLFEADYRISDAIRAKPLRSKGIQ